LSPLAEISENRLFFLEGYFNVKACFASIQFRGNTGFSNKVKHKRFEIFEHKQGGLSRVV